MVGISGTQGYSVADVYDRVEADLLLLIDEIDVSAGSGRVAATRQAYHRSAPFGRARSEMHDMICPLLPFSTCDR
jgi:hypothetical protein